MAPIAPAAAHAVPSPGRGPGESSEDHHLVGAPGEPDAPGIYLVADGLGATRGAGNVSRFVVDTFAECLTTPPPPAAERRDWIIGAIRRTARRLMEDAKEDDLLRDGSSSLTGLVVLAGEIWTLHVGDSRIYRLRDGVLEQQTEDHSVAWEQYRAGAFPKERIATHPSQRFLTRTFSGRREFVIPDVARLERIAGDRYLLATDGLTKVLTDAALAPLLGEGDPETTARRLVDAAIEGGADDDVTILVVDIAA